MKSVATKDTGPEVTVRRLLHGLGHRYRLHRRDLPGSPDIVFVGRKKVVFVHGCFWHGHECAKGRGPKSRQEYWGPKLAQNKARDARNVSELEAMGWGVLTVWQCELNDLDVLRKKLLTFLG